MIRIQRVSRFWRVIDKLFVPIMILVNGFKLDSIQETHIWHIQNIDPKHIDLKRSVLNIGDDNAPFQKYGWIIFHIPILGGWKKYTVLENSSGKRPWYIGWYCSNAKTGKFINCQIQKLPISDNRIRLLSGTREIKAHWFALDEFGNQIDLKIVDKGSIGDKKYPDIRLF